MGERFRNEKIAISGIRFWGGFFVDFSPLSFTFFHGEKRERNSMDAIAQGRRGRARNTEGKPQGERDREGLLRFVSSESQEGQEVRRHMTLERRHEGGAKTLKAPTAGHRVSTEGRAP